MVFSESIFFFGFLGITSLFIDQYFLFVLLGNLSVFSR